MSSKIIYSLIARERKIILADYTEYTGNFQQIALNVLRKLKTNSRYELIYDKYSCTCLITSLVIHFILMMKTTFHISVSLKI